MFVGCIARKINSAGVVTTDPSFMVYRLGFYSRLCDERVSSRSPTRSKISLPAPVHRRHVLSSVLKSSSAFFKKQGTRSGARRSSCRLGAMLGDAQSFTIIREASRRPDGANSRNNARCIKKKKWKKKKKRQEGEGKKEEASSARSAPIRPGWQPVSTSFGIAVHAPADARARG